MAGEYGGKFEVVAVGYYRGGWKYAGAYGWNGLDGDDDAVCALGGDGLSGTVDVHLDDVASFLVVDVGDGVGDSLLGGAVGDDESGVAAGGGV